MVREFDRRVENTAVDSRDLVAVYDAVMRVTVGQIPGDLHGFLLISCLNWYLLILIPHGMVGYRAENGLVLICLRGRSNLDIPTSAQVAGIEL
jgi:hypothetical protein